MSYPNWFGQYAQGYFEKHLAPFVGCEGLRFLQIGAFTGDASLWLLENVLSSPGSHLHDVDTWAGSDEPEHESFDWTDVERTYDEVVQSRRVLKCKMSSREYFHTLPLSGPPFNFVYIDGDHTAPAVLSDAVNAWPLLNLGGLLAFDDYLWKPSNGGGETKAPGIAIDAFLACYADRLEVVDTGLQVWVRKLA